MHQKNVPLKGLNYWSYPKMFQTKVSVFKKAVILDHPIFYRWSRWSYVKVNSIFLNGTMYFFFDDFLTIPMIIHIDRVLLTSAESKHFFLLTYQLVTCYPLMWVHRNAKMNDFQEYFDMLMVLGKCRKHYRNAQDLYAARYPNRQQKSHMVWHESNVDQLLMKIMRLLSSLLLD